MCVCVWSGEKIKKMLHQHRKTDPRCDDDDDNAEVKKKVKAVCGSYSTAALRHIVLLPE